MKLYGSYRDTFGLPVTTLWTLRSGAGPVTIADPTSLVTDFTASVEGVYVFRLTAQNSIETVHDDVQVVLRSGVLAVDAGPDQTTYSVDGVVNGAVTKDTFGLSLTFTWSMVSGPGSINFDNPHSPSTGFHMSFLGTYVLRFTATNGLTTASDDLTVSPKISGRTWGGPRGTPGNFQWYGFKPFNWAPNGRVADYYLLNTGSGFSEMQQWFELPYVQIGVVGSVDAVTLGGSREVNASTGAVTGSFGALWLTSGNFCSGSSWRGSYGGFTGDTYTEKTSNDFVTLLPFYTTLIVEGTTRKYITAPYPPEPTYLDTYCGNPVWGDPTKEAQEELSNQMTVEQAAMNGGSDEISFTAHTAITSYDSVTGLAVGTVSELDVSTVKPSRTGDVLVSYSYVKTPITGGSSEYFSESLGYHVGVGNKLSDVHIVPMIVGQDVKCVGLAYQDIAMVYDDFESLDDGWYGATPRGWVSPPSWIEIPTFDILEPGDCYADFEVLGDGVFSSVVFLDYYWPTGGVFGSNDYADVYDNFEAYPDSADLGWAYSGIGWAGLGHFSIADYRRSYDDFEVYADGTYTTLTDNTDLLWAAAGTFNVDDYLISEDDFETYSDGTYTTLSGGVQWTADGTMHTDL